MTQEDAPGTMGPQPGEQASKQGSDPESQGSKPFQILDFTSPPRDHPVAHPPADPPVCEACRRQEMQFFDPGCPECQLFLSSADTSIPELFAILRQWTPPTQQNLELIIREILRRGAHIDDRDALTDMTLLQYIAKAGAQGVGDVEEACRMTNLLLNKGANVYIRSRWTNMAAIHYASYFDVAPVVKVLLKATKGVDVDTPCSDFDNGTPLHICATHVAIETARVLLQNGADPRAKDDLSRIPADCVPDAGAFDPESDMAKLCHRMKKMLQDAEPPPPPSYLHNMDDSYIKDALRALGVKIGEKVVVGGVKNGVLRYCGPTSFAQGMWAGIELDESAGKNDGSVSGISYFKCSSKHGIFAPFNKISKPGILVNHPRPHSSPSARNYPKVNTSKVSARVDTGMSKASRSSLPASEVGEDLQIGDMALVAGQRKGVVRFCGTTDFAPGVWYGVELDLPVGKNDGTVSGKCYFACKEKHGVFAPPSRVQKLTESDISLESFEAQSEKHRRLSVGSTGSQQSQSNKKSSTRGILRRNLHSIVETSDVRPKSTNSVLRRSLSSSSSSEFKLTEGMSVFCSNELGVVRYIGPVDFAEGTWLGVELRTPKGKNDGSVQGKRYFSCKPGYGLIVRPNKVTVRGISGAKLLADNHTAADTSIVK